MKIKKANILLMAVSILGLGHVTAETKKIDLSQDDVTRKITTDSKSVSFDDMVVRHAKRLCNGGFSKIFAQDGRDFIDFWHTAQEVNLDVEKAYTCMRLFSNNIKSCELVDNTVTEQVLGSMTQIFGRYFEKKDEKAEELKFIQDNVEDLMLGRFTDQLDMFQTEPDVFISKLSTDIIGVVKSKLTILRQEEEEREFREKLRTMTIRFADTLLNKTIWYEDSYHSIWQSVISISDALHTLGARGIINDQDNLDELWDSLTRRFVWFLDFKGSLLPTEFYEQIEEDLKNNVVFFLEVDEQDDGIKSKKEMIAEAVVKAKAKTIAFEQKGVITDQTIELKA